MAQIHSDTVVTVHATQNAAKIYLENKGFVFNDQTGEWLDAFDHAASLVDYGHKVVATFGRINKMTTPNDNYVGLNFGYGFKNSTTGEPVCIASFLYKADAFAFAAAQPMRTYGVFDIWERRFLETRAEITSIVKK